MLRTTIGFLLLFMLSFKTFAVPDYYFKSDGNDNNECKSDVDACATISKAEELLVDGVTLNFNRGDMWREQFDMYGFDNVTIQAYGTGELPHFTGFDVEDSEWSEYGSTGIYSAVNATEDIRMVLSDGEILTWVAWNIDIATTAVTMTAGTFTTDESNDLLYVYDYDGSNPNTHEIEYTARQRVINSDASNNVTIRNIKLSGAIAQALLFGSQPSPNGEKRNCDGLINGVVVEKTAGRGIRIDGHRNVISDCDISYYSMRTDQVDLSGIVIYGQDNIVENNYIHDSIYGSAIELNGLNTYQDFTKNNIVRYNTGFNCSNQFLEIFYSSSNTAYGNKAIDMGTTAYKITQGSSYNKIYNELVYSSLSTAFADIWIGYESDLVYSKFNEFSNISIYDVSPAINHGCIGIRANGVGYTDNMFRNIVIHSLNKPALYVCDTNNVFDYNCYYLPNNIKFNWGGSVYTDFSFYQSASGQDSNSKNQNPYLRTDGSIAISSPCIAAGTDIEYITVDINGVNRTSGAYSIGAAEYSANTKINGCALNGGTLE